MTKELLKQATDSYIENVKKEIEEMGGMYPHLVLFGTHKSNPDVPGIIHVPVNNEFMADGTSKDVFVEVVIPDVAEEVKKGFDIEAVAWASEAWLQNAKDKNERKECFVIHFEYSDKTHMIMHEMIRTGKKVNEKGELIDIIDLVPIDDLLVDKISKSEKHQSEGRFSNLLRHFV